MASGFSTCVSFLVPDPVIHSSPDLVSLEQLQFRSWKEHLRIGTTPEVQPRIYRHLFLYLGNEPPTPFTRTPRMLDRSVHGSSWKKPSTAQLLQNQIAFNIIFYHLLCPLSSIARRRSSFAAPSLFFNPFLPLFPPFPIVRFARTSLLPFLIQGSVYCT